MALKGRTLFSVRVFVRGSDSDIPLSLPAL